MKRLYLSFIFIPFVTLLHAQEDTTSTGEIVDAEIIIEKEKEIRFPVADKRTTFDYSQRFDQEPLILQHERIEPDFKWPDYKSDVPFEDYPVQERKLPYQNYLKAGYGNFGSPLLETGIFQRVGDFHLDLYSFYERYALGPVAEENSASSQGIIDLSATYETGSFNITPEVYFGSLGYNYYGNTNRIFSGFSSDSPVEASFRRFDFGVKLAGQTNTIRYSLKPVLKMTNQMLN